MIRGRVLTEQGQFDLGLAEMRDGIERWDRSGAVVTRPYYLGLLAEGLALANRPAEGSETIDEALSIVDRTGERYYEAELTRLHGELYLQARSGIDAEGEAERRGGEGA